MSVPETLTEAPATPAQVRTRARRLVELAALTTRTYNRPDLAAGLEAALARIDRPQTLIAVVGAFKQGKSSLVNALLGEPAAVVDDDLATAALTVFAYGESERAVVTTSRDGDREHQALSRTDALAFMSEATNPENALGVEMVEVNLAADFLASGAVLVDTPGAGGLSLSSGAATLRYLQSVDAVLFVSDASAPLNRMELDYLVSAAEACPAVLLVLTKVDLYPEWRRVAEINERTLDDAGVEAPVVAVSSVLAGIPAAFEESGIPNLRGLLEEFVVDATRTMACVRAVGAATEAVRQVQSSLHARLATLEDPASALARQAELQARREQLEHLRGPGARWLQVLSDELSDSFGEADHRFRTAVRAIGREIEDELERVDPLKEWDRLSGELKGRVAAAVSDLIGGLIMGAEAAERSARALLRDSEAVPVGTFDHRLDTASLWSERPIDRPTVTSVAGSVLSSVRGGSGGITTVGVLAGLAGITLATAATAGIGLAFGGKQILDERKRQLQARRQQARTLVRQFIDDVQFEASKRSRDLARDQQRVLREHFSSRVAELQRTCSEAVAEIQRSMEKDTAERAAAVEHARARAEELDHLVAAFVEVEGNL